MQKRIVVGNWKLDPGTAELAVSLYQEIAEKGSVLPETVSLAVVPPILFTALLGQVQTPRVAVGSPLVSWEKDGPHTGGVSVSQLLSVGVSMALIGHSEMRDLGETDLLVQKRTSFALKSGMVAIVCVGESSRDLEGRYLASLAGQVEDSLSGLPRQKISKLIVAYEPLWAIGKKAAREADPHEVMEAAIFIRRVFGRMYGQPAAKTLNILYGGSVTPENARQYVDGTGIAGLLLGRASLDARMFAEVARAIA